MRTSSVAVALLVALVVCAVALVASRAALLPQPKVGQGPSGQVGTCAERHEAAVLERLRTSPSEVHLTTSAPVVTLTVSTAMGTIAAADYVRHDAITGADHSVSVSP